MEKQTGELLIIFYRNPEPGAVKTRLAATIGDQNALRVYIELCRHTRSITQAVRMDKIVFYSTQVGQEDMWPDRIYQKAVQDGADLGQRMNNAFLQGFVDGYDSICIIGTDCYELTSSTINKAFIALRSHDAVIGPAEDGGYYMLGLRKPHPELFLNKKWSTNTVFKQTLEDFQSRGISYFTLPLLRDVDVEADLPGELRKLFEK